MAFPTFLHLAANRSCFPFFTVKGQVIAPTLGKQLTPPSVRHVAMARTLWVGILTKAGDIASQAEAEIVGVRFTHQRGHLPRPALRAQLCRHPLGPKGYNGRVERSHRSDDEEFYRP